MSGISGIDSRQNVKARVAIELRGVNVRRQVLVEGLPQHLLVELHRVVTHPDRRRPSLGELGQLLRKLKQRRQVWVSQLIRGDAGCCGSPVRSASGKPAAGVICSGRGPVECTISQRAPGRCRSAQGHEGRCNGAPSLRLSARACDAGTTGLAGEPEKAETALSRREATGEEAWWPETGTRDAQTDVGARKAQ